VLSSQQLQILSIHEVLEEHEATTIHDAQLVFNDLERALEAGAQSNIASLDLNG